MVEDRKESVVPTVLLSAYILFYQSFASTRLDEK